VGAGVLEGSIWGIAESVRQAASSSANEKKTAMLLHTVLLLAWNFMTFLMMSAKMI
jgi:hypothetical protein